ncbi:MAG: TonB-dependent receptor, partial [Gemmatimonadetes bacterium]|nr:TonB-dependent receptor [Gemmatimonadota bacterium]
LNMSEAGDTYLLQTGNAIVDKSRMFAFQIQHGMGVADVQDFIYGVDLQRTEPRTDGTITGRNEADDIINEMGGYVHSTTNLSDNVDLVAAIRVDYHNRLQDLVLSPRAALVFRPTPEQNFRLTFNRAFSTPTTNNLFLDLVAGRIPLSGDLGYNLTAWGVPESGFTFTPTPECQLGFQGYCMWSPFHPEQLPAHAALAWDALVQALLAPNPATAPLVPFLLSGSPTGPAIATVLRRFNQEAYQAGENPFPLDPVGPEAISRMKPTITNTFEVGYKGLLGDRFLLAADVYVSSIKDFVGPLRVETPSVFLDPAGTAAYITTSLTPLVLAGMMTPAELAATVTLLTTTLAAVPIGTVAPDQSDNSDLLLTYRNFGDVDLWGADVAMEFIVTDRWSLKGSASYVSDECFDFGGGGDCKDAQDIALNAPNFKGSFGGRFHDAASGVSFEARVRYTDGFPMNSGVYVGDIETYTVFDANIGYQIPWMAGTSIQLMATNLFDD